MEGTYLLDSLQKHGTMLFWYNFDIINNNIGRGVLGMFYSSYNFIWMQNEEDS